jgi:hypothetical protein
VTRVPQFDHHEGFEHEELRDLIAEESKGSLSTFGPGTQRVKFREFLVEQVEKAQARLDEFDRGTAWRAVLGKFGWKLWDVSECVDYDKETYVDFVGSEDELREAYPDYPEEE